MFKTLNQHIFRSPYQSLAAVLVVSLAFFAVAAVLSIGLGSQKVLSYFESRPQVTAFLKDEVKPEEIESLKNKIEMHQTVKQVDFISKDEALKIYKEQNKDNPLLLEMVTAKILPASLEVSTKDLASLKQIAEELKNEPEVEDVIFQEDVIVTLSTWTQTIRKIGLALAIFLLAVSVLIILVILGIKISQRKDEIEVLKLLGASSGYIRLPLYLEGMIYGAFAALISWGLSYLAVLYVTPFLVKFLSGVPLFPVPILFMLELLAGLLVLGVVVGFLGSFLAVWRFIRAVR